MNTELTIENHKNCPACGSANTKIVTDYGRCLCGGDCWSHPECLDCGYSGYMNSDGIYWDWDTTVSNDMTNMNNPYSPYRQTMETYNQDILGN